MKTIARVRRKAGARDHRLATMSLQLRDHVHWCASGGRAVFLDIDADRYFCLPGKVNDAFLRLAARQSTGHDGERLQSLVAQGILVEDDGPGTIRQPPVVQAAVRDLADRTRSSPLFLPLLRQLASEIAAGRRLRTRSFAEIIGGIEHQDQRRPLQPPDPDSVLQAIAGAAWSVSFVTRIHDRCLVRALAVHSICARRGIRPKLVFGVNAHPFAAHCWVQLGDAMLVGGFEQARLYTPILVLE